MNAITRSEVPQLTTKKPAKDTVLIIMPKSLFQRIIESIGKLFGCTYEDIVQKRDRVFVQGSSGTIIEQKTESVFFKFLYKDGTFNVDKDLDDFLNINIQYATKCELTGHLEILLRIGSESPKHLGKIAVFLKKLNNQWNTSKENKEIIEGEIESFKSKHGHLGQVARALEMDKEDCKRQVTTYNPSTPPPRYKPPTNSGFFGKGIEGFGVTRM